MRLLEVDLGSARDVLAVLKGQADNAMNSDGTRGQVSTLPFPVVMRILRPFDLGISTPDGLIALKNAVDPAGDVIQDIGDDGSVTLNTNRVNPNQDQAVKKGTGPAVSAMAASGAKKLSPDI